MRRPVRRARVSPRRGASDGERGRFLPRNRGSGARPRCSDRAWHLVATWRPGALSGRMSILALTAKPGIRRAAVPEHARTRSPNGCPAIPRPWREAAHFDLRRPAAGSRTEACRFQAAAQRRNSARVINQGAPRQRTHAYEHLVLLRNPKKDEPRHPRHPSASRRLLETTA